MEKMRIVHMQFAAPYSEGMSYQENLLTKYQARDGHDVIMMTINYKWDSNGNIVPGRKEDKIMNDGVRLISLSYRRIINDYLTGIIRKMIGVYDILLELSPDIIFFHGSQSFEILTVIKYLKTRTDTKLFIDNHADQFNSATTFFSRQILHKIVYRYLAKRAEPYASKFFGVTPSRVDFLTDLYGINRNKCELLLMGADDDRVNYVKNNNVRSSVRKKLGYSDKDFVVLTGGKIDMNKKQVFNLLDAITNLNDPNVRLLIFGSVDDSLKDSFMSYMENSRISYMGWSDSEQIYSYFSAADLAVFPGTHSVLWEEAVGSGLPCLFKYFEGTTHLDVGGNCRFLHNDSEAEIKSELEGVIYNSDEYFKMKKVAENSGIDKFSYQKISRKSIQTEIIPN
jgi:1,2-diacylglycerol 3-alpha-glucosyltransferase